MSSSQTFETHIRLSNAEHVRATRFLNRASWAIVTVLTAMGASIWVAPVARRSGHPGIVRELSIGFIFEFFALIALVVVLRWRLAKQIQRSAAQREIVVAQNERLIAQNDELEHSNSTLVDSERRQHSLTDEMRLLSRRLGVAQQVAKLGYWEIDSRSGSVFWSDEMFRICGLEPTAGEPPTDAFLSVIHPDDRPRMQQIAQRAVVELTEFTEQYRIPSANGPTRTVQAQARIIKDEHTGTKLVGTVQDVTDRLQLENQLRQSQKMDAIGHLAGGVAHDFNNILTVIEGYASILISERPADDPDRESIQEIMHASRRAAALTRQLLAFSRQQVLQPRVLDLNDTLAGVESMLRRLIGEHIDFHTVLEPELYPVIADPGQVEQVLMNLAVNARDAMSRGGALTIETANVTLDAAYAERHHVKHPGRHVMIAVTDTGRGMPASELERIFEPFFTTKENGKGTGLGLSTVHGIVEQSGGHISVYSEVGHGTTFKVYLPIAVAENTPIATETERKTTTARGGSETVLLVEDDAVLRTMASSILRRAGYMVIEASDGLDALRIAGDSSVGIDLVVSDMVMPAMGGRDLATHLERIRPRLPTLLMSGYTRDAMVHSADLGTASWFLEKPFTPDTLTRKVREVLDRAV